MFFRDANGETAPVGMLDEEGAKDRHVALALVELDQEGSGEGARRSGARGNAPSWTSGSEATRAGGGAWGWAGGWTPEGGAQPVEWSDQIA